MEGIDGGRERSLSRKHWKWLIAIMICIAIVTPISLSFISAPSGTGNLADENGVWKDGRARTAVTAPAYMVFDPSVPSACSAWAVGYSVTMDHYHQGWLDLDESPDEFTIDVYIDDLTADSTEGGICVERFIRSISNDPLPSTCSYTAEVGESGESSSISSTLRSSPAVYEYDLTKSPSSGANAMGLWVKIGSLTVDYDNGQDTAMFEGMIKFSVDNGYAMQLQAEHQYQVKLVFKMVWSDLIGNEQTCIATHVIGDGSPSSADKSIQMVEGNYTLIQ